jgi:hypothetical protein
MHQQVRTSSTKSGSGSPGPGAMADPGGVADILRILDEAEVNLQTAGGRDLDQGGDFVFAVHHEGEDDDGRNEAAAELLRSHGYGDARAVSVHTCSVADEHGGLRGCVEEVEQERGPVYEIFVGAPDENGRIPVQITTRADAGSAESA